MINAYASTEWNDTDHITSFGVSTDKIDSRNNFGGELFSAISVASVLDKSAFEQEYVSWDVGARLGYFGNVFAYVEAGIDVGELILSDAREDDHCCNSFSNRNNDIDGYAGVGVGVDLDGIRIEAFAKARSIDGDYWESRNHGFYGIRLSIPIFNTRR